MQYVIARGAGNPAVRSRYLRSIASRADGSITAIGYGTLSEAQVFPQEQPAKQLVARLSTHPIFSLDRHAVETFGAPANQGD